jgi:lambda repressor-like predicted transcriptional regulator
MTKIDETTRQALLADYRAGIPYKTLLRKYHLGPERLKRYLVEAGLYHSRRPDYSSVPRLEILNDYRSRMPPTTICAKYQISRNALYDIIHEENEPLAHRISPEKADTIVAGYVAGKSLQELSDEAGFSMTPIESVLTKRGIARGRRLNGSNVDIASASAFYRDGLSLQDISKRCNTNRRTLRRVLEENDIPIRSASESHRIYAINENFFKNPNTPTAAYFLGFLWADGSNVSNDTLSVTVNSVDDDIMIKLRGALGSEHPFYRFSRVLKNGSVAHYTQLAVSSQQLSSDLTALGMVGRKTYAEHLTLPVGLSPTLLRHFIRGMFDGDGSISLTREGRPFDLSLTIAGHIDVLRTIQRHVFECAEATSRIHDPKQVQRDKCKTYVLTFAGNRNILKLLQWMYMDSSGIRLNRKYDLYRIAVARYFREVKGAAAISHLNYVHP